MHDTYICTVHVCDNYIMILFLFIRCDSVLPPETDHVIEMAQAATQGAQMSILEAAHEPASQAAYVLAALMPGPAFHFTQVCPHLTQTLTPQTVNVLTGQPVPISVRASPVSNVVTPVTMTQLFAVEAAQGSAPPAAPVCTLDTAQGTTPKSACVCTHDTAQVSSHQTGQVSAPLAVETVCEAVDK